MTKIKNTIEITQKDNEKIVRSPHYNYFFNTKTGFFVRWGKTLEDDPLFAPAPELLDIEITTKCSGVNNAVCDFCYKSNTPNGENMSFDTFKKILDKFPNVLTQVAFGADSKAESNPDLFKMMEYCIKKEFTPNITVAEITNDTADKLVKHCGAVAVSRYKDKEICYDSVKKLTDRGLSQVNIHCMIAEETFDQALETLQDRLKDKRLEKLKAIVFLSLKQKGRGYNFTPLSQEKFNQIVNFAFDNKIQVGFDSCSAYKFLKTIENHKQKNNLELFCESCESTLFSAYINVKGEFFPCSFAENGEKGIDVTNCSDFVKDIWNNKKTKEFRKKLIQNSKNEFNCRKCPLYNI